MAAGDLAPGGGADEHQLPAEVPPLAVLPPPGVVGCVVGTPGQADCPADALAEVAPLCPLGFVVDPTLPVAQGGLPRCKPDPARCAALPFGLAGPLPADALYVDASAGDDANSGTLAKPFATVAAAVAAAKPNQTVAIQAGAYNGSVTIAKPITLRGRCAEQVHLFGNLSTPAITFALAGGDKQGARGVALSLHGIGRGVEVSGAGSVQLEDIWLGGVTTAGVLVKAGAVQARRLVVDGTLPNQDKLFGDGIAVTGGSLQVQEGRITRTLNAGASAHGGTTLELASVVIDGVEPQVKTAEFGYGVSAQSGAQVSLLGVRVHGASRNGIFVSDAGTALSANRLLVDATRQASDYAVGVQVQLGATASLSRARLSQNAGGGIALQHPDSMGKLSDVLVDANGVAAASGGSGGIAAFDGAQADLDRVRSSGNRRFGLLVSGAGAVATARRVLTDGTLTVNEKAVAGQGIAVLAGAKLRLDGARSTGNQDGGIQVAQPGSELRANRVVSDHTQALSTFLLSGWGLDVREGAQVWLSRARLVDNQTLGLFMHGADARLHAVGLLVADTQPRPKTGSHGRGINVQNGARLALAGSIVRDNRDIGMASFAAGPHAWTGVVVTGTGHAPGQQFGLGVSLNDSNELTAMVAMVVRGNHSVGVVVCRARATLAGSVLADTLFGAYAKDLTRKPAIGNLAQLADGIHADVADELKVLDSFVVGNLRAGMLARQSPKVALERVLVAGGHFGIAATGGPLPAIAASVVVGTGQAKASDSGLVVAPVPQLVKVEPGP